MLVDILKNDSQALLAIEKMAGIGHWLVDLNREQLFWSPEIFRVHGVDPDTYQPSIDTAVEFYHPDDRRRVEDAVGQAIQSGEPFEFELRIVRPDKVIRYVRSKGECEFDSSGKVSAIFGTFQDVTEDKKNAIALKEALDFQSLLMRKNPDYIFVKDTDFRILEANPAFLSFYPPEKRHKVIGFTTLEEYPPDQAEEFLAEDKKAFSEGVSETVETIDFPDGITRVLLTKKIRFENAEGQAFILGIARDISEIKRAQDDLRQANEELEEFAYRTSHDLRSPLVSSLGLLDLADKKIASGDLAIAQQSLAMAQRSIKKLDVLVQDILALAKAKNKEEVESEVNVYGVVEEALGKFSQMQGFKDIGFENKVSPSLLIAVKVSRFALILENLISNAIKYYDPQKPSSYIKIEAINADNHFVFSVSDNGLGIPSKQHKKLFSMFNRFHPKTSFGSGLGLYMVKKSTDVLGGAVEYLPLEGGSRFILRLPEAVIIHAD